MTSEESIAAETEALDPSSIQYKEWVVSTATGVNELVTEDLFGYLDHLFIQSPSMIRIEIFAHSIPVQ